MSPRGYITRAALAKQAGEGKLSWEPEGRPRASPALWGMRRGHGAGRSNASVHQWEQSQHLGCSQTRAASSTGEHGQDQ